MTKTLTDYQKENYLVSSYCIALKKHWCMNTSCSTCGAMDLRNQLFEHGIGNAMSEEEKKELRRTTRFYPRTSELPKEMKNKVILSHVHEFNKLDTDDIELVNRLITDEWNIRIYHDGFKDFIRFMIMDIWQSLEDIFSRTDKLAELKKDITSPEVLKVIDDMNEHYLSRGWS